MTEKNLRGREFLVFPHCAYCTLQKFGESNFFLTKEEITKKLIWRNIFLMRQILLPQSFFANFPSNQRFTKELYSILVWRKKFSVDGSEFLVFLHCALVITQNSHSLGNISSNQFIAQLFFVKNLIDFTNIFAKTKITLSRNRFTMH